MLSPGKKNATDFWKVGVAGQMSRLRVNSQGKITDGT